MDCRTDRGVRGRTCGGGEESARVLEALNCVLSRGFQNEVVSDTINTITGPVGPMSLFRFILCRGRRTHAGARNSTHAAGVRESL
jgi:hypothetical protein